MKRLAFTLKTNDKLIINETVGYYVKENKMIFKIKERIYYFNIIEKTLEIKDKEKNLYIDFNNNVIIINLLNNNIKVDYPILKSNLLVKEKSIYLEYVLDGDELIKNVIEIEYI